MSYARLLLADHRPKDVGLLLAGAGCQASNLLVARSGPEVLDWLLGRPASMSRWPPPLAVILELDLPIVSGWELLRRLKSDGATRRLPVVVFTSSRAPRDIEESYSLGANSYVVKPQDADDFQRVSSQLVRYWLSRNERWL